MQDIGIWNILHLIADFCSKSFEIIANFIFNYIIKILNILVD